ncbi:MAG: (5-formylfuran-3-yl)methyl phosphate synthase [Gemmataceae bacterium]
MTQLLVSVRSATEAESALRGGASLIDVKEPAQGSLGRASDDTIAEVVRIVAGRRPVSAALGELADALDPPSELPLAYVKWGLAGSRGDWRDRLWEAIQRLAKYQPNCCAVAVSYADWRRARTPTPEEICSFAVKIRAGAFLLDTWRKDGSTLLDWLSPEEIEPLLRRCRAAGVPIALAGSLSANEIRTLLPLRPHWFAVRGAVCQGRDRATEVEECKVRRLAELLETPSSVPAR